VAANDLELAKMIRPSVVAALLIVATACGGGDPELAISDPAAKVAANPVNTAQANARAQLTLSAADLDGFEKGIARETQLVREATDRASKATTPEARGEAIQAGFETNTIPAAAPATGLSRERYQIVRSTLSTILTTLDFQEKIDGPQSIDPATADAAMKARLAADPYSALDPASADAFKARLGRIVPVWVEYVRLTAVGG
jgi:hypothetical protein